MKRSLFLVSCAIAAVLSAAAAPLPRAEVSAHPDWVLHVDADALRQTYLGKYLLYQMDKPEMNSNMMAFQSIFSFDLRTQLHGVTLYANEPAATGGVYVINADATPERLISLIKSSNSFETFTNNHSIIYSWVDLNARSGSDDTGRRYAAFVPHRMIVGKRREGVVAAVNVIAGAASSLATGKVWPELGTGHTDFVQGAARKIEFPSADPLVGLLKMARQLKFHASESNEQLTAVLTAMADDESTARELSLAAQGLIALMNLQGSNPQTAKLTSGLTVKQNGAIVTVTLSMPSSDLIAVIKAYTAKKEK